MKIYNVFYFKFLNLVVINSLFNQKNSLFIIIIVKNKNKSVIENILNFKKS